MNRLIMAAVVAVGFSAFAEEPRTHDVPVSKDGNLVVGLCDGKTSVEVKGVKDGRALSREQAQAVSDELMTEWKKKNPGQTWDAEEKAVLAQAQVKQRPAPLNAPTAQEKAKVVKPGGQTAETGAAGVLDSRQINLQTGHTYGAYSDRDQAIWDASTKQFVERGDKIFHDAKELGGTVAISCDMCHPNAANTHPETYPKYQVQLGKVALLRDMINWCIENPVRGKPLKDDDEKLKALEAFIYAQRKGTKLEYGKH